MDDSGAEIIDLGEEREIRDPTEFHKRLVRANVSLLQQLELLGKTPPHIMFVQSSLEALIDVVCGDDAEALQLFHLAADTNLHDKLKGLLKSVGGG